MKKNTQKTSSVRNWHLLDAQGKVLGRLATEIATLLRGKHKATFLPHIDDGDMVVVINTDGLRVTGTKATTKLYQWHTWHPHGFKQFTFTEMMERDSREVLRGAVYGMLPKNRLRDRMITHLKLYKNAEHPHASAPFHSSEKSS